MPRIAFSVRGCWWLMGQEKIVIAREGNAVVLNAALVTNAPDSRCSLSQLNY